VTGFTATLKVAHVDRVDAVAQDEVAAGLPRALISMELFRLSQRSVVVRNVQKDGRGSDGIRSGLSRAQVRGRERAAQVCRENVRREQDGTPEAVVASFPTEKCDSLGDKARAQTIAGQRDGHGGERLIDAVEEVGEMRHRPLRIVLVGAIG
jgi:hypothetical protein